MSMNDFINSKVIEYVVMNPSQNITILATTSDDDYDYDYGFIAKKLLKLEPTAEQVGFLQYGDNCDIMLNMAGGEFCGNATMSAAVYYGIMNGVSDGNVIVKSSGVDEPVNVHIKKTNDWEGIVEMPEALEICEVDFGNGEKYPVVFFKGIAHVIIDKNALNVKKYVDTRNKLSDSEEFENRIIFDNENKKHLESKIKEWCEGLEMPALGVMLCDGLLKFAPTNTQFAPTELSVTPLVYVKSIDSLYWESSCASGTTAVGAYLLDKYKKKINVDVKQASGTVLNVESTEDNKLLLKGKVKFLYKKSIMI